MNLPTLRYAKTIHKKRALGAFYTPSHLSKIICDWAIQGKDDVVLEPSFGGCNFLEEIARRILFLGLDRPLTNVYGCDIDSHAFDKLIDMSLEYLPENFLLKDFLSVSTEDFGNAKADCVIGNPPYIGNSQLSLAQKLIAKNWRLETGIKVDARASLWVYFIVHSLQFIKVGGRMAFVLPGSFLSSDYSKAVRELLRKSFENILLVSVAERVFVQEGADERTIILLASGFRIKSAIDGDVRFSQIVLAAELQEIIDRWSFEASSIERFEEFGGASFVSKEGKTKLIELRKEFPVRKFKEFSSIGIGIVTGNTKFFIRTKSDWASLGISDRYLRFILPKVKGIGGINLTEEQVRLLIGTDQRCLLLNTDFKWLSPQVMSYLESYPGDKSKVSTYAKRSIWHQPDDKKKPFGFLSYITHDGPRLLLNGAGVNCTNSLYRVFLKEDMGELFEKFIAVAMFSSYTQLNAEIIGRPLGSGALKLEPKEALELEFIMPPYLDSCVVANAFASIDAILHSQEAKVDECRRIADGCIGFHLGAVYTNAVPELSNALDLAKGYRRGRLKFNKSAEVL